VLVSDSSDESNSDTSGIQHLMKILTYVIDHWSRISMSLLRVTVFPHVILLKMKMMMMVLRTARDFCQQHGIDMWNLS